MHQILERIRLGQIFQAAPVLAPVGFPEQGAHAGQIQLTRWLRARFPLVVMPVLHRLVQRIVRFTHRFIYRWQVEQLVNVRRLESCTPPPGGGPWSPDLPSARIPW